MIMKKIYSLTLAILALATISCSKENFREVDKDNGKIAIITATTPSIAKTALGEKTDKNYANYWKENDQLSVNGVASDPLDAKYDGKAAADFSFTGTSFEAPYCAAYPAGAVESYASASARITIPDDQAYVEGSYDPLAFVMIGKSESTNVELAPVVSILHVKLTGEATVNEVTFAAGGDKDILSGTFSTDFTALGEASVFGNYAGVISEDGVALPADFYVCVKSGEYQNITMVTIANDGTRMVKEFNIKKAFEQGKMYNVGTFEYVGTPFFGIATDFITTSTVDIAWNKPNTDSFTIAVYSDSECTELVKSYEIPCNEDKTANACWYDKAPKFCVSGLAAGTTYYIQVEDSTDGDVSEPAEVTTLPFTNVQVSDSPATIGDVILAEDFSELMWHAEMIGEAAGWTGTSSEGKKDFSMEDHTKWQRAKTESERNLSEYKDAVTASRLAHWAQGANIQNAIHPGYIKLVASSKITHLVTPSLVNIPAGNTATLEVTLTACPHYSATSQEFETSKAIVAVQSGNLNELTDATTTNSLDLESNVVPVTLILENDWNTYTVTLDNVPSGARIAFGPAADVVGNNGRMALSDISVKILDLQEVDMSVLEASAAEATSSTLCFSWTHPMNPAYNNDDPYTFGLYTDEACQNPVIEFETPEGSGLWDKNSTPKFIFGRLEPNKEYFFKVEDTNTEHGNVAEVVSATTKNFTVVTLTGSPVEEGQTLLAEDFGEIQWDFSQIYKAVGFFPTSLSDFANSTVSGFRKPYDGSEKQFYDQGTALDKSRLKDWAVDSNVYIHAGHLKLGTSSGKGWILTPELPVPEGYAALINVTVTVAKFDDSQETDWAVAVIEKAKAGVPYSSNAHRSNFSWTKDDDHYRLVQPGNASYKTITVEGLKMLNGDRVVFGPSDGADKTKSRAFITDIKIDVVKYISTAGEEMIISDAASLQEFAETINDGTTLTNAQVTASFTLTEDEAAALPEIEGYAGTFNGNSNSIAGLRKPLFKSIVAGATIKNLTVSGNVADSGNDVGLLARTTETATISNVTTEGSVTVTDLNLGADAHIGGGFGKSDAAFSNCTNKVNVELASCSDGTKALSVGGLVGSCGNNTSFTYCDNEGNVKTSCNVGGQMQIGGVTSGDVNKPTDHCTNTGNIYVGGNVGGKLWVGGVLGYLTDVASVSYLTNGEEGTAKGKISCKSGITLSKQIYVGGVTGGEPDKKTITHSHLVNYGELNFTKVVTPSSTGFWYFGGCVGGSGTTYTTYEYCENYGKVYLSGQFKARFGGCIPYTSKNPTGAKCIADLEFYKNDGGTTANSHAGGVVGYISAANIEGLVYKGSFKTQGCSPRALVGGISGEASDNNAVFTGCKVATTALTGAGDSNAYKSVGLITSISEDGKNTSFVDCEVQAGSKRGAQTIESDTELVLNVGEGNAGGLCGHKLSSGTVTNCKVVESID